MMRYVMEQIRGTPPRRKPSKKLQFLPILRPNAEASKRWAEMILAPAGAGKSIRNAASRNRATIRCSIRSCWSEHEFVVTDSTIEGRRNIEPTRTRNASYRTKLCEILFCICSKGGGAHRNFDEAIAGLRKDLRGAKAEDGVHITRRERGDFVGSTPTLVTETVSWSNGYDACVACRKLLVRRNVKPPDAMS